ncbi:unnamed protein product [Lampetra fluviatilis]
MAPPSRAGCPRLLVTLAAATNSARSLVTRETPRGGGGVRVVVAECRCSVMSVALELGVQLPEFTSESLRKPFLILQFRCATVGRGPPVHQQHHTRSSPRTPHAL